MASTELEHEHREEDAEVHEAEDTGAQVAPIVRLEEVAVTTGEEDEDAVLDLRQSPPFVWDELKDELFCIVGMKSRVYGTLPIFPRRVEG
ncbi:unnamed protein product [Brassica napus]|uniref:(rape) hypothetical protein n=1 Tax=Brassica napus TaxID=3708 RepID=A0A816J2U7_BRANA|nr:unnamed protein product [Brassica napus]